MKIYPASYCGTDLENTNYAVLSSSVLEEHSDNFNKDQQAIFKIIHKNKEIGIDIEIFVGVKEFSAPLDTIYVNTECFNKLLCQIGDEVEIEYYDPPPATLIKLKPLSETFYEVMDIKSMLEKAIVTNYPFIQVQQILKINSEIEVLVESLEPFDICRTNNIDLNVEFVEMDKEEEQEQEDPVVDQEEEPEEEHLTREQMRLERLKYYSKKYR